MLRGPRVAAGIFMAVLAVSSCGADRSPRPQSTLPPSTTPTNPSEAADDPARDPWVDPATRRPPRLPDPSTVPLDALAGQLVMTAVARNAPAFDPTLIARIRRGHVAGVIVSDNNALPARPLTRRLTRAARRGGQPPLLVAVDQEGGRVRRLRNLPPVGSAARLGRRSPSVTQDVAQTAACRLRRAGITLDFAPVADVPQTSRSFLTEMGRAYGRDAKTVGRHVTAFVAGLQRGGVGGTLKHFPGLGTAATTTDVSVAAKPSSPRTVRSFADGLAGGADVVMMSSATYRTGRWATGRPAVLSASTVGWLRRRGFEGVVITDDLDAAGVATAPAFADAPVDAIRAGVDLLLYVDERGDRAEAARARIVAAVRSGEISRRRVEAAWSRVLVLKYRLALRRKHADC